MLVCSKQHPLACQKSVSLKDLSQENFLLLEQKSQIYHICINALSEANIKPKIVYSNTRHNIILEMVAKNLGITFLPKNIVNSESHNLKIIKLTDVFYSKIALAARKNTKYPKHCTAFWNFFQKHRSTDCYCSQKQ